MDLPTYRTEPEANAMLDQALAKVESESIRAWVRSQRSVWVGAISKMVRQNDLVNQIAILIMCEALGL